jgi:hypothetical protein
MAGPKTPIGFDHLGLGSVLSRNRLTVPLNQREYSWEKKHVIDLLTDFIVVQRGTVVQSRVTQSKAENGQQWPHPSQSQQG